MITKGNGFTFAWMIHLAFNILLLGAAKSRCRFYVQPWLVEGMLVVIMLGTFSGYCLYCAITNQKLQIGAAVDVEVN